MFSGLVVAARAGLTSWNSGPNCPRPLPSHFRRRGDQCRNQGCVWTDLAGKVAWRQSFLDSRRHRWVFPFHGGRGWSSFPSGHTTRYDPAAVLWAEAQNRLSGDRGHRCRRFCGREPSLRVGRLWRRFSQRDPWVWNCWTAPKSR